MTRDSTGTGDPAKSMALLWGSDEAPDSGPGPKPGRSVTQIVRAAIELADRAGLAALSMRQVALRLGVATMSLYTYLPGKAELLDVMLDTVYGELPATERASPGRTAGWRAHLDRVARDDWALYQRHPWMLQVATGRPPLGPNLIAKYERELAAVDGVGLSDVEMDSVITLVNGFVHGAARGAADASTVADESGLTDEQWWAATAPYLDRVFDATTHPLASRVGAAAGAEHGAAYGYDHAFEFGLARLLDGIAVFVEKSSPRSGPS